MSQDWTPPPASGTPASVPNYLVHAILALICCFPLGGIALIFAAQVNGRVASGDIQGALDYSKKAKIIAYIFLGLGLAFWILQIVFMVLGVGLSILGNAAA
jgi:hypothetical protein